MSTTNARPLDPSPAIHAQGTRPATEPSAQLVLFDPVPGHPNADVMDLLRGYEEKPGMKDAVAAILLLKDRDPVPSTISDACCQKAASLLLELGQGRLLYSLAKARPTDYLLDVGTPKDKTAMLTGEQKAQVLADISESWPEHTPVTLKMSAALSSQSLQTLHPFLQRPVMLNVIVVQDGSPNGAPAADFAAALRLRKLSHLTIECSVPQPEALQAVAGALTDAVHIQIAEVDLPTTQRTAFDAALVAFVSASGATKLNAADASISPALAGQLLSCRDHWDSVELNLGQRAALDDMTTGKLKINRLEIHSEPGQGTPILKFLELMVMASVDTLVLHGTVELTILVRALQIQASVHGHCTPHIEAHCLVPQGLDFEQTLARLRRLGNLANITQRPAAQEAPGTHRLLTADEEAQLGALESSKSSMGKTMPAIYPRTFADHVVASAAAQTLSPLLLPRLSAQDLLRYMTSASSKHFPATSQAYFDRSKDENALLDKLKNLLDAPATIGDLIADITKRGEELDQDGYPQMRDVASVLVDFLQGGNFIDELNASDQKKLAQLLLETGQWQLFSHLVQQRKVWAINVNTPEIASGLAAITSWSSRISSIHLELDSTLDTHAIQDVARFTGNLPPDVLTMDINANRNATLENWGALTELAQNSSCKALKIWQGHDAQTPIAHIIGFLHTLEKTKVGELDLTNFIVTGGRAAYVQAVKESGIPKLEIGLDNDAETTLALATVKTWERFSCPASPSIAKAFRGQSIPLRNLSLNIDGISRVKNKQKMLEDIVGAFQGLEVLELWGDHLDIDILASIVKRSPGITTVYCKPSAETINASWDGLEELYNSPSLQNLLPVPPSRPQPLNVPSSLFVDFHIDRSGAKQLVLRQQQEAERFRLGQALRLAVLPTDTDKVLSAAEDDSPHLSNLKERIRAELIQQREAERSPHASRPITPRTDGTDTAWAGALYPTPSLQTSNTSPLASNSSSTTATSAATTTATTTMQTGRGRGTAFSTPRPTPPQHSKTRATEAVGTTTTNTTTSATTTSTATTTTAAMGTAGTTTTTTTATLAPARPPKKRSLASVLRKIGSALRTPRTRSQAPPTPRPAQGQPTPQQPTTPRSKARKDTPPQS